MDNYETMKYRMQEEFIKYDQEKMIRKFRLPHDQDYLYIRFTGRMYRIRRTSGKAAWSDDHFIHAHEAGYNEAMTIYDVLCCSGDNCRLSGEFVNMEKLSSIQSGSAAAGGGLFQKIEKTFDHKHEVLSLACERLNGTKYGRGDVAYQIPLFDFLPIVFQFWNSDEEFAASLTLLTDKNMLQYMHYETVFFAVGHLMSRLAEEMAT